jgi:hypothetical protein
MEGRRAQVNCPCICVALMVKRTQRMRLYEEIKLWRCVCACHWGVKRPVQRRGDRDMKSISRVVWIVPAILLMISTLKLPDGYYTFTKIVTCGVAAIFSFAGSQGNSISQWSVLFALVAVLFNPVIPIHLSRPTWVFLDFGTAAAFAAHLILIRCAPWTASVGWVERGRNPSLFRVEN